MLPVLVYDKAFGVIKAAFCNEIQPEAVVMTAKSRADHTVFSRNPGIRTQNT